MSAADQATAPAPTRAPASAVGLNLAPAERPPVRPRVADRLRALDGLRLLAALMVCMYHFTGQNGEVTSSWDQSPGVMFPTLSQFATYGGLGVQFFFVISGFVICMSSRGRGLGDFFRSRISRLYPAYWVAIVMVTGAALLLPVVVAPVRPDELLVNLTMMQ